MIDRPWLRALAWLALLGPLFFLTYNFANAAASQRAGVAVVRFTWENHIPFVGWTILPYWSSDLLYAVSLGLCRTRAELDLHAKRLVAIQVFAVACFLAFPMQCAFDRPSFSGWDGKLFAVLYSFDQPFNQAPSLHVALAVLLWMRFKAHTSGFVRGALAAWFGLIVISTLTTYQHQFIDVPMGAWAGVLVLAALPERRRSAPHVFFTSLYMAGALLCTVVAFAFQGVAWLLLWPGFALSMVAAAYWTGNAAWLNCRPLMVPYTLLARLNSRLWTRGQQSKNRLTDTVWIGRAPSPHDRQGMNSVVSLAPELAVPNAAHVAMLDLVPPTTQQLQQAVQAIESLSEQRPTLVCCALGYSRSAIAAAAWLLAAGHARNADEALAQVRKARPQVVIREPYRLRLEQWWTEYAG